MRVVSGTARGVSLRAVPGKRTRPTTDKVKEAIFSMIGPYFDGGAVLDLFAGTGALGIEALSRGAERAVFVDIEPQSIQVIKANLQAAKLESQAEVYRNEASHAVKALLRRGLKFDYVFLDPPYRMKQMDELLEAMQGQDSGLIRSGGTVVLEHDADTAFPDEIGMLRCRRRANYGDTAVSVYHIESY